MQFQVLITRKSVYAQLFSNSACLQLLSIGKIIDIRRNRFHKRIPVEPSVLNRWYSAAFLQENFGVFNKTASMQKFLHDLQWFNSSKSIWYTPWQLVVVEYPKAKYLILLTNQNWNHCSCCIRNRRSKWLTILAIQTNQSTRRCKLTRVRGSYLSWTNSQEIGPKSWLLAKWLHEIGRCHINSYDN